ncbi:hypothetical protein [Flavobacterium sp.]|uniref:hypothetical protein n=1 Tax=Flavobacterium sp. TaxID=239 RepID=UPI00375201B3
MKNILKIMIFLHTIILCGQEGVEVPLNSLSFEHPNGTYIKDFNDVFQPYIGTWKGEKYGKELILEFVKFTKQTITAPNGDYYYEDELMIKYQLKEISSGAILSSTINALNYEDYRIISLGYPTNGKFDFLFTDTICSNTFDIIIENIPNVTNQLKYVAIYSDFWDSPNCTYTNREDIPIPIPFKINMILTKQ